MNVASLPFTSPWLLAPMDGITDPAFRDLVLGMHAAKDLGGAFTEFVRVNQQPVPAAVMERHLGPQRFDMPVGLQLMGNNLETMPASARVAVESGAPLVDINFGCPARGPFRHCAGSALLADPPQMERIIRSVADAVPEVPTTAKIRSGVCDDSLLEDVAHAVQAGGASLLTIHCRTKTEGYRDEAIDWSRIARVVAAVDIPVCGNGGVGTHAQLEQMRRETGCEFVMVGRGAIADPWIFSGKKVSAAEAARFLIDYGNAVARSNYRPTPDRPPSPSEWHRAAGRVKQLLRYWTSGDLFTDDRESWLREPEPQQLLARLEAIR